MAEKERQSGEQERPAEVLPTVNPDAEKSQPPKASLHPAVYIATWISLSSSVIIFNKWILDTAGFRYPIVLTTWHLAFATFMTQILARCTSVLDSRKKVPMTGKIYLRAIVPIGLMFSLSLICGNLTYLYLSVSFIQMLKVRQRGIAREGWESELTVSRPRLQSLSSSHPGSSELLQSTSRRSAMSPSSSLVWSLPRTAKSNST